jgi:Zn-dependent alcohol dehydrogenase
MQMVGAVVESAGGPFVLSELELDDPRPDEVVVRIKAVGMCHTDLTVAGGFGVPFPLLLGHEGAGIVEQTGSAVTQVAPGDRVSISFAWCGSCPACMSGHPAFCADMFPENFGGSRVDGSVAVHRGDDRVHSNFFGQSSFATRALVREQHLVKLDADVPFEIAAPLGCGLQTGAGVVAHVLRPGVDDSFVVFGAGAVGMAALMMARASGVAVTAAVEPHASRRELALDLGATAALDPSEPDLISKLHEISGGGFSSGLDTSGRVEVIRDAFASLRERGALALVASGDRSADLSLPIMDVLTGKRVQGVILGDSVPRIFIPQLIGMWRQGAFPVDRLVRTFPLEQIDEAVHATLSGEVIKPVLIPS